MKDLLLSPINTDALIELIAQRTAELLINQTPQRQEIEQDALLSRAEAMRYLKITTATLWRYEKKGKITSHGIGGKRYFKKSELEQSLIQKNRAMSTQNINSSNILLAENNSKYTDYIEKWQTDFTSRIKQAIKSKKHVFTINDAIEKSEGKCTPLDKVFIENFKFINSNPLRNNDYFKYLNSYKNGKTLNEKYFKHDLELLHQLYKKVNKNPSYTPFSKNNWEKYVLFMLLKFKGLYEPEKMDVVFNVKTDENREYNPITIFITSFTWNVTAIVEIKRV